MLPSASLMRWRRPTDTLACMPLLAHHATATNWACRAFAHGHLPATLIWSFTWLLLIKSTSGVSCTPAETSLSGCANPKGIETQCHLPQESEPISYY